MISDNDADTAPHFLPQRENNAARVSPKTFFYHLQMNQLDEAPVLQVLHFVSKWPLWIIIKKKINK